MHCRWRGHLRRCLVVAGSCQDRPREPLGRGEPFHDSGVPTRAIASPTNATAGSSGPPLTFGRARPDASRLPCSARKERLCGQWCLQIPGKQVGWQVPRSRALRADAAAVEMRARDLGGRHYVSVHRDGRSAGETRCSSSRRQADRIGGFPSRPTRRYSCAQALRGSSDRCVVGLARPAPYRSGYGRTCCVGRLR
jgi:hypothetical protein